MSDQHPLDDPEKRRQVVRTLLVLSPVSFVLCYFLAWVQGARPQDCLLIAAAGLAMCLGAALVIHLMGSKSATALIVVRVLLALLRRR